MRREADPAAEWAAFCFALLCWRRRPATPVWCPSQVRPAEGLPASVAHMLRCPARSRLPAQLVEAGKLEEARAACAEQVEEAHEQLRAGDAFRAEYFALWEMQRKQPVHAGEPRLL